MHSGPDPDTITDWVDKLQTGHKQGKDEPPRAIAGLLAAAYTRAWCE